MFIPKFVWPVISLCILATASLSAQTYDFHTLRVPDTPATPPGVLVIQDINAGEHVVGTVLTPGDTPMGYAFQADLESFTPFRVPGADLTIFNAITDSGAQAGHFVDADGSHGFLLDNDGAITVVDFPGHTGGSWILGLNNWGTAVGVYCNPPGVVCGGVPLQGFRRTPAGDSITLRVPGAVETLAIGINDHGRVVGYYVDSDGGVHGFLWSRGRGFRTIDVPGASYTDAWRLNNRGDIVGSYVGSDGLFHGYLRTRQGAFVTIDFPGAVESFLTGVTDDRDVVGGYIDSETGEQLGFMALCTDGKH